MAFKLNYKIVGRMKLEGSMFDVEYVQVEWRHADGPIPDYEIRPLTHPPDIKYETVQVGEREFISGTVGVKPGTPDSIVMQMLEERRAALAATLGVEP